MRDKEIKIDYLSATFPLVVENDDNELAVVIDTVKMISNYLNNQTGRCNLRQTRCRSFPTQESIPLFGNELYEPYPV